MIIFVHGFMGSDADWSVVQGHLNLQAGSRSLTVTLPGHGDHPDPVPEQGLEGMAHWLAQRINQINQPRNGELGSRLTLVGYSLGGRILMTLATQIYAGTSKLAIPAGIKAMIIESAHPGLAAAEKKARWQTDQEWSERLLSRPLPEVLERWYQQPLFEDVDGATLAGLADKRCLNDPRRLAEVITACSLAHQPDYRAMLLNPPFPLYYWYGERDEKYRCIAGELLQAQCLLGQREQRNQSLSMPDIQGLKITEFRGAGHNCHLACPVDYARQLSLVLSAS